MKKKSAILFIIPLFIIVLLFTLVKNSSKYNEKNFIGKTSAEIISQYGPFDFVTLHPQKDGLYKNCKCGYTIQEWSQGFWGSTDELLFYIAFNENGVAVSCFEGVPPAA